MTHCVKLWVFQALPQGGIHIFASQLHTHLAGRGVRTVLVRGGAELEVVQEDQHFSTHYQARPRSDVERSPLFKPHQKAAPRQS